MNMMQASSLPCQLFRIRVFSCVNLESDSLADSLPQVIYRNGTNRIISNPTDFPEPYELNQAAIDIQEPIVSATIICPDGRLNQTSRD
jgi:translation elongation factor EF-4